MFVEKDAFLKEKIPYENLIQQMKTKLCSFNKEHKNLLVL